MRVLIYSETENAKKQLEAVRAEGHHASLRNPQYFNPSSFEQCDAVIAESEEIIEAYRKAGIEVDYLIEAKGISTETVKEEKPLAKMNKTELLAEAEKRGVEVPEGATNKQIVEFLS